MTYVLDASIALKWELPEPDSGKAIRLRDDLRNGVHLFIAPDSFILEVAHGLAKAERQGRIPDAEKLWLDAMITCPKLYPFQPLILRAVQIARQAHIGVYDCLYVALGEREGCQVVTADNRLIRNLQPTFPFLTSLDSWP
jgi:predicted nucleic acid-binding protein